MSNHLKPCPFCGGDASFNEHTDGCYFTVLRKLKTDPPADLSRVPDLIEAWNTRTAIQQAESEPVRVCVKVQGGEAHCTTGQWMSDEVGYLVVVPKEWQPAHPAPGVPDGVVRDTERLNELEALVQSKGTHGLSFDYCKHVEDGYVVEKGFRVMWRHHLGERKPTLREAIDAASPAQKGGE